MEGFIFLHRKIFNWEWYDDANTFRLFIHCLLRANHKEGKWRGILIKRGSFITSRSILAKELKIGVQSVRTSLNNLKSTHELTIETSSEYSIITIQNYNDYQKLTSKLTHDQPATNPQLTTNNNDNNDNNVNKEMETPSPKISYLLNVPELDLQGFTQKYQCTDRQVRIKAEQLHDYCQAKGKIYKDYKAFLRNAISKDFGERVQMYMPVREELPELSEEQRNKNVAMIEEMKKRVFKNLSFNKAN